MQIFHFQSRIFFDDKLWMRYGYKLTSKMYNEKTNKKSNKDTGQKKQIKKPNKFKESNKE